MARHVSRVSAEDIEKGSEEESNEMVSIVECDRRILMTV